MTGWARFGADAVAPGMLVGRVLRSPHAHARIRSIDTSKALALEGIVVPDKGLNSDIHASAEYRAHLVTVMAQRAVATV